MREVAWDASAVALDTDAAVLFDVVIVNIGVDPRHENALALEVRTVDCAGDFAATRDDVDADPCAEQATKTSGESESYNAGDLDLSSSARRDWIVVYAIRSTSKACEGGYEYEVIVVSDLFAHGGVLDGFAYTFGVEPDECADGLPVIARVVVGVRGGTCLV